MGKKQVKTPLLDLHGKKSDEIYDIVDKFIMKHTNGKHKSIHIMTGKGKGIVKSVVTEYLKQAGYPAKALKNESGKTNDGILVVYLD